MSRARRSAVLHRNHRFHQVARFALVGGSGVVVDTLAFVVLVKVAPVNVHDVAFPLVPTPYNVRWLHVFSLASFIVANLWNFELNRIWTFKHSGVVERTRFLHFFIVGLAARFVGFFILTALTHPHSPVRLPPEVFDDSSGVRTMAYWAQLIMIVLTTPLSFLLNKFWTFKHDHLDEFDADDDATDDETDDETDQALDDPHTHPERAAGANPPRNPATGQLRPPVS